MLNKETKKKIDNARNILVGVLPLPSDQIELITITLIYKFMDDQDEELRSIGLEEKFFVDNLKDYSWQHLMSNQLSADQRVTKFINAIEEIQKSKHIPSLFKEIFTNTFLKFRDGRVLQLFLDKIDEFSYDHSEELGNAFEYLLMTMGAQGDNGQFRTPRNIIDFLVEVVNPTKNDSIIDPACGTGGFLVSAYKHILRSNTTGLENFRVNLNNYEIDGIPATLGDKLTATERKKLEQNVEGYDNTPLMVRLARVNLYLHHFTNPKIHEYDTLNYDTRWKEKFDCILANPPFMTPKGGIEPHDKFRIRANRTEILFADYILEHLTPNGKAGFVVPEGLIFTASSDFTELRKWMIYEAGLWAVISLPAHIFQPYSGVKTSIILIDREVARTRSEILLVKIENDGFSLNTNRTPIKENDLPEALHWLDLCKTNLEHFRIEIENNKENSFVKKLRLLDKKEFASLNSYKSTNSAYIFCKKFYNKTIKSIEDIETKIELEKSIKKEAKDKSKREKCEANIIVLYDNIDKIKIDFIKKTGLSLLPKSIEELKLLFDENLKEASIEYGVNIMPSEILTKGIKDAIDKEREYSLNYDSYAVEILKHSTKFELKPLSDVAEIQKGSTITEKSAIAGNIPVIGGGQKASYFHNESNRDGDIITVSSSGAYAGFINYFSHPIFASDCTTIKSNTDEIKTIFLYYLLKQKQEDFYKLQKGGAQPHVYSKDFENLILPIPSLEIQLKFIEKFKQIQSVIDSCSAILENYLPSFEVNPDWPFLRLSEVCEIITDGTHHKPRYTQEGFKFLSAKNVTKKVIDWVNIKYIDEQQHKELSRRVKPRRNDILLAKNGTTGVAAINDTDEEFDIYVSLALLRPSNLIDPYYLLYVINSELVKNQFNERLKGVGVPNLHLKEIKEVSIPVPSLNIQKQVVEAMKEKWNYISATAKVQEEFQSKMDSIIKNIWSE